MDEQRRLKGPILNELNVIQAAAQNIMGLAGARVTPINIVGLAFGFVSNTFTNIQSGLLLEVDKSTVETFVIQNQNYYRTSLPQGNIDNRATAIYVLRSYLRICTAYTIANQINTTVTLAHGNAGPGSPLIDPSVVHASVVTPRQQISQPVHAPAIPPDSDIAQFFQEKTLSSQETQFALNGLCLDKNTVSAKPNRADLIKVLPAIYESYRIGEKEPVPVKGVISPQERQEISGQTNCGDAKNFYEKRSFADTEDAGVDNKANIAAFASQLTTLLGSGSVPANLSLNDLGRGIKLVRNTLIQTQKMNS